MAAAALARNLYHFLDRHRLDDAVDILAADFRGHGLGSDRAGFRTEAAAWLAAFPDLRISVRRLVTEGNRVAAWISLTGTHEGRFAGLSPSRRPIDIAGVDLLVERAGRFVEAWSLRDLNGLWVQLGVLPGAAPGNHDHNETRSTTP
jgi:predicted ester cyclase